MLLQTTKWIAATLLFLVSAYAGFVSLKIAQRYHRLLNASDAFANGIFIGAALCHLLPDAYEGFYPIYSTAALPLTLIVALACFFLLMLGERISQRYESQYSTTSVALLVAVLTIHAFTAGTSLGMTQTVAIFSTLFAAIIAHKGFALFALVIYLFKRHYSNIVIRALFLFFSLITPLGIMTGTYLHHILNLSADHLFRAYFNAIAAGSFLYIGCLRHALQSPYLLDGHRQYSQYMITILGIALMGLLALWI